MYNIGDKIVYPMHGAGIIENIERKEILGKERQYYILSFLSGDLKIMVPIEKSEEVGVRGIINREDVAKIQDVLSKPSTPMANNWNRRYRENLDKIKSGDAFQVAEVARNLYRVEKTKNLSAGEKKMLENAMKILKSELALSMDITVEEAFDLLYNAMENDH